MKQILKKKIVIPLLAITVFITGTAFQNDFFEIAKQIEIFTTLFKEVNMNYVDDTNPGDLMDTAIKSMLKDLDPYTNFMNEQDVEAARINNTGDYIGIGAKVRTLNDKLVIVEPYKDYPADKAGLKAGDEIIKVGNILLENYKDDAGELLKGAPGTAVEVTYKRQGNLKTATINRAEVEIKAVPYFSMINEKTGYIVLSQFSEKAASQTSYAVRDLKAQGAKRLVLDLRGNPGGLVNEAKSLLPHKYLNALNTVGYKELFKYLEGEWTLEFAISEIKKNTRRFAKRQLTWYRKDESIMWFDYLEDVNQIISYIENKKIYDLLTSAVFFSYQLE